MPQSHLRLIRRCAEFLPQDDVFDLPRGLRGIYALYKMRRHRATNPGYDLVYIGMARSGIRGTIRGRLMNHRRKKRELWTHFSVFEVWPNIRDEEVIELEGLFRHLYRKDSHASKLNLQRGFRSLRKVRDNALKGWLSGHT